MPRKKRIQKLRIKQLAANLASLNRCATCNKLLPKDWTHELCVKCSDINVDNEAVEIKLEPNVTIPSESSLSERSIASDTQATAILCCENCHRDAIDNVTVLPQDELNISFRKKLCLLKKKDTIFNATYDLCNQCYTMLIGQDDMGNFINSRYYSWSNCWPAFFWFLFQHQNNEKCWEFLWRMTAYTMQRPWQRSFQLLSEKHHQIVLDNKYAFFSDITALAAELKELRESMTLVNYIKWADKVYYCTVKCPWGCSEFTDDVGYVSYHKLLYHVGNQLCIEFPIAETSIKTKPHGQTNAVSYDHDRQFVGMLKDFVTSDSSDITFYMDLDDCPISPSLQFLKNIGPMVCTCKRHNKGSSLDYLHPPKNPLTKMHPVSVGDPIGQVALAPRTVTTIKTNNRYSTTYQMQKCNSGFRGSDSCDIKEIGQWDKDNELSRLNATLAYYGRADIRANIQQLIQSKVIPFGSTYEDILKYNIEDLQLHNREFLDLLDCKDRSTRINLLDVLKMTYHNAKSSKLIVPKDEWPPVLAFCHPHSNFPIGVAPKPLPKHTCFNFKKYDFRLLTALLSMATTVPPLWECVIQSVPNATENVSWHGFFLTYATGEVLKVEKLKYRLKKLNSPYYFTSSSIKEKSLDVIYKLQCHANDQWANGVSLNPPENWTPQFHIHQVFDVVSSIKNCVLIQEVTKIHETIEKDTSVFILIAPTADRINNQLSSEVTGTKNEFSYTFKLTYCGFADFEDGFHGFVDTSVSALSSAFWHWHISMGSSTYTIEEGFLNSYLMLDNLIAVYIRIDLPDSNKLRQEYLSFMGNSSNILCPKHNCLLVTKPLNKSDKCCKLVKIASSKQKKQTEQRCEKTAAFRCPIKLSPANVSGGWRHCPFMICKSCNETKTITYSKKGQKRLISSLLEDVKEEGENGAKATPEKHRHRRRIEYGTNVSSNTEAAQILMNLSKMNDRQRPVRQSLFLAQHAGYNNPIQHDPDLYEAMRQSLSFVDQDPDKVPPLLDKWLQSNGLAVVGDFPYTPGNCLYDSVSYTLGHGTRDAGFDLRLRCLHWNRRQVQERTDWGNMLVEALQLLHVDDGEVLHEAQSVEQYCDIMQDITKYATQLDVMFICGYLQTPLAIYSSTMRFQTSADGSQVPEPNLQHDDNFDHEPIKVYFKQNGAHYEPIVPLNDVHQGSMIWLKQRTQVNSKQGAQKTSQHITSFSPSSLYEPSQELVEVETRIPTTLFPEPIIEHYSEKISSNVTPLQQHPELDEEGFAHNVFWCDTDKTSTDQIQIKTEPTDGGSESSDNYSAVSSTCNSIILPPFLDVIKDQEYSIAHHNDSDEDHSLTSEESSLGFAEEWEKVLHSVPSTDAAVQAKNISIRDKGPSAFKLQMHVLLNMHGSCLQRKGHPLSATRRQKQLLEGIVATSAQNSIALIYPEAMLFPPIFWNQHVDGSYEGAIPVTFMNRDEVAKSYGYAPMADHLVTRITSPDLLCSTSPEYIFYAFDVINNISSVGADSRLLFRRGHQHIYEHLSVKSQKRLPSKDYQEGIVTDDAVDSRIWVQNLSAMMKQKAPTFFYTHTCNQTTHPGVRCLTAKIQQKLDMLEQHKNTMTDMDYKQHVISIHNMNAVQMTRTWLKVGNAYMNYIIKSHEKPLGTVVDFFYPWENQDLKGNLAHLHALLWVEEDRNTVEDNIFLNDKIRCSTVHFFNDDDIEDYLNEGLLCRDDWNIYTECKILDEVKRIQTHSCASANFRCHRRIGLKSQATQCRVPDYFEIARHPATYNYEYINPNHSHEAKNLFMTLDLLDDTGRPIHDRMKAGKYTYPALKGEKFSPCNPRLWLAHQSSDNLLRTDQYFSSRYLVKYATGIDDMNKVKIKAGKDKHSLEVVEETGQNTKITSSNINQKEAAKKRRENPAYMGRALGLPEIISLLLAEPQIYCSRRFVRIPSVPLEERPGILHETDNRSRDNEHLQLDQMERLRTTGQMPVGYAAIRFIGKIIRNEVLNLPLDRRFTEYEELIIADSLDSPVSLDKISIFSCRPPELRFIPKVAIYWCCFTKLKHVLPDSETHRTTTARLLQVELWSCGWVDGLDCQIKVKPKGIQKVLELPECTGQTRELFELLNYGCYGIIPPSEAHLQDHPNIDVLLDLFVDVEYGYDTKLPLPVFSTVKPHQTNRFLIHVLLSMGSYSNEAELFAGQTPTQWFRNAKLLPGQDDDPVTEEDINNLTKKVILEDLAFLPSGTISFDKACLAAHNAFKTAFSEDNSILNLTAPSCLHTQLVQQASNEESNFIRQTKETLMDVLSQLPNAPSKEDLMAATTNSPVCNYIHELQRLRDQSQESFQEATQVFNFCRTNIDRFSSPADRAPTNIILNGGPGTGKTFQLKMAALYAASLGLNIMITAFICDRAIELGGIHLHNLFCLPAKMGSVHQMADHSIRNLKYNPLKVFLILILHILFLDEMGNTAAELLAVIEIVLRYFRKSSAYMGGVLIISTMDHKQLPPIRSTPALMSTLIITNFQMKLLKFSVRARADEHLIKLIENSRLDDISEQALQEFKSIIIQRCNHVKSWDDPVITRDVIRILGTRKAVQVAEEKFYLDMEKHGITIRHRIAENLQTVPSAHGQWKPAEQNIILKLNRMVNEPNHLRLYPMMLVDFTWNRIGVHSNGQMGILLELPQQHILDNWLPFEVMAAPPGVKTLPSNIEQPISKQSLEQHGWKSIMVTIAPEKPQSFYQGVTAKRKQYSIRHRLTMTIHRGMGCDFGKVATSISSRDGSGFNLWMKEQVIVLISRTNFCKNLIFVGESPEKTADILCSLLRTTSPYSRYMDHVVHNMTNTEQQQHVLRPLLYLPYNLRQEIIPVSLNGYVYCIMSLRTWSDTYIGTTKDLKKRVRQHNSGTGALATRNPDLTPWVCIGFVVGFPDKKNTRLSFEQSWQETRIHRGRYTLDPIQVLRIGIELVDQYNSQSGIKLTFIQCIEHRVQVESIRGENIDKPNEM